MLLSDGQQTSGTFEEVLAAMQQIDVKQAALLNVLASIEAHLDTEGWDKRPELYLVQQELLAPDQMALVAGPTPPLPDMVVEGGGPAMAAFMQIGARNMAHMFNAEDRESMVAFALAHEGWKLTVDVDDLDAEWDAMQAAREHTIHERPDRVECRIIAAAARDGVSYTVMRERGGPVLARVDHVAPEHDDGTIPQGLRALAAAL